jgi:glycerol kinase
MSPTPPTPRAPCSTTSARGGGTKRSATCWASRWPCCPRCATAPAISAPPPGPVRRGIPILGVAGDQQAATLGQACFEPGMMKSTYGTGCFALLNTGDRAGPLAKPAADHHRLPAGRQADLCAGRLDLHRRRGGAMAARRAEDHPRRHRNPAAGRSGRPRQDVVLVPAFTGLGAPYWNPIAAARSLASRAIPGPAELARAALESVGYQTRDLLDAMRADWPGGRRDRCCASMAA